MRIGIIAFLVGICFFQSLSSLPSWYWIFPLLAGGIGFRFKSLGLLSWLSAGFALAWTQAAILDSARFSPEFEGKNLVVTGEILDIPQARDRGVRFMFSIDQAELDGRSIPFRGKVRLSWFGRTPELVSGDYWRLTIRLKRPTGLHNPGSFDYETWLYRNDLRATGYVRVKEENRLLRQQACTLCLDRARQSIAQQFRAWLPEARNMGILTALAIGVRHDMEIRHWNLLSRTGTGHLVAISGLHIGLVAGLVFFLVRRTWVYSVYLTNRLPAQRAAACFAFVAALVYAMLAGFSIPTQRALVMVSVAMLAILWGKNQRPAHTLALALFAVLLLDARAVLAPGFWLSFAAVAVLLYGMTARIGSKGFWWKWGRAQWVVAIGLFPIGLFLFQSISWVSPFANLLVIPWISFLVVPLVLLAIVMGSFSSVAATFLLRLADVQLDYFWKVLDWFASLPQASWIQAAPSPLILFLAVCGILLVLAPRGMPGKVISGFLILPALLHKPAIPAAGDYWISLLDVGQGLSAVVQTRSHVLVFDTGASYSDTFDMGRAVVIPFLTASGVRHIDTLIVSHDDNDHIGGASAILEAIQVDRVFTSAPDKIAFDPVKRCNRSQRWTWDGVTFHILHPGPEQYRKNNNRSCVLRISSGAGSVLLPGDIEKKVEYRLLKENRDDLRADILVAPHHGSRTSSSQEFIDAVRPAYVLFPVAYRSRFRHPNRAVVERYRDSGATMLLSPEEGMIRFRISREHGIIGPESYRKNHLHYWYRK